MQHTAPKHRPYPVSRSEYGRRVGRGRSTITELCQTVLKPACLPGGRIDAASAAAIAYAERCGVDPSALLDPVLRRHGAKAAPASEQVPAPAAAAPASQRGKRSRVTTQEHDYSDPPDVSDLLNLPLRTLLERHGSALGFADWLDCRKKIADTRSREIRNELTEGQLIYRDFVRTHVFGLIDRTNRQLLSDFPQATAHRVMSIVRSGGSFEDVRAALCDGVSKNLEHVKQRAAQLLSKSKEQARADQEDAQSRADPKRRHRRNYARGHTQ